PNGSIYDYINLSGGFTRNADEDNIFVIKSSGAVIPYSRTQSFFSFTDNGTFQLEPGDSIVIPYYARLNNPLVTWMNVSTVLFNLATTILAIESVGN
ncbi:MAG: polysaccharide biosynthesis protein, partial [Gammaproteobacteria bacterium]